LHAFAREVDLTPEEWIAGIGFLTAVGQKCSAICQEFILLSDTLGLSSVVNSLNDKRVLRDNPPMSQDTKSSLLGPFYRQGSPAFDYGQSVSKTPGNEIAIYGRVQNAAGQAIASAAIQVWQTDEGGMYDTQRYDGSEMDMRGTFHCDSEGRYCLRTVRPLSYSIPMDGPVGDLIRAQRRHGMRPAHTHFLISAPGYRELVTALYMGTDEYIDSDTVFGVTESLVTEPKSGDQSSPFPALPSVRYDFVLTAAGKDEASGRVGADPSQFVKQPVGTAH
jgi:hydroxyquinol 1,2-dioxygenase